MSSNSYNNNKYNQLFGTDLYRAYLEARKRKIATSNEFKFESHLVDNLGYQNYGRYVDDFFFVLPAEEVPEFRRTVEPVIDDFITGLDLTLHPAKRGVYPVEKGVPFLGVRIYPYHIIPDHRTVKNYRVDLRRVLNNNKNPETLISYMGRLQHMDSQHLQKHLWREAGFKYRNSPHGGPNARFYTDPKIYDKNHRKQR